MATYIDINGNTQHLQTTSKTLLIENNPDIREIVRTLNITNIQINNNPNLERIQFGQRGVMMLGITGNPKLTFVQTIKVGLSVDIYENPLLNYNELFVNFADASGKITLIFTILKTLAAKPQILRMSCLNQIHQNVLNHPIF